MLGNRGGNRDGNRGCPWRYQTIKDEKTCKLATKALGYSWHKDVKGIDAFEEGPNPLCQYCFDCSKKHVRLITKVGKNYFWLCQLKQQGKS